MAKSGATRQHRVEATQITNNKRPIVKPEDLQDIKLRVPKGVWRVKMFKAYGANPTPLGFSEAGGAVRLRQRWRLPTRASDHVGRRVDVRNGLSWNAAKGAACRHPVRRGLAAILRATGCNRGPCHGPDFVYEFVRKKTRGRSRDKGQRPLIYRG